MSLDERRLCGDLIAAFQYLKEVYYQEGDRLFIVVSGERIWGNSLKLREGRFRLDTRKLVSSLNLAQALSNLF